VVLVLVDKTIGRIKSESNQAETRFVSVFANFGKYLSDFPFGYSLP
jgi:hypothetical protein